MEYRLLTGINSPADLKAVEEKNIPDLCAEMRDFLVSNIERTGGHLASNLGVTELTVAIHRVFDSPKDHIIFDVGHQSYVHKLITGRRDMFSSLRTPGGLSGFTNRSESLHDPFGAGHSSTSVSAALGFAEADALSGSDAFTVAVIGDGAYTGGMAHEALNNCKKDLRLIIILNENRMSISKNKGAFASYLAKVRISKGYRKWKSGTNSFLTKLGGFGRAMHSFLSYSKNKIKRIVYSSNYFEDLGLYYIGPVNGNDYQAIHKALREAKSLGKCAVIHTYTKKGKGYEPAERAPDSFHNVSGSHGSKKTLHSEFASKLIDLADKDKSITAITAAMGIGTGLSEFGKSHPERYFDVGIAEEHALTFAAGLAAAGMKPYAAIYSTFLQRAYDNIIHDIALQKLPVRMIIDRAGLAVADGATHHGIFDVAFLSHIPGIEIYAPVTYRSLGAFLVASVDAESPVAIRYSNTPELSFVSDMFYKNVSDDEIGVLSDFEEGNAPEYVFITYGNVAANVLKAQNILRDKGINSGIILCEKLAPYGDCVEKIAALTKGAKRVLFVEEGIFFGGFSMIAATELRKSHPELSAVSIAFSAIDGSFAVPSEPCDLYDHLGLSAEKIAEKILNYSE